MRDLREFHDPHLHLPIGGKDVIIESPSAEDGLRIVEHMTSGAATNRDEVRMIATLFHSEYNEDTGFMSGGKWEELNDIGLSLQEILHVGTTALAHFGVGEAWGEFWWETRLGKAQEPLTPENLEQELLEWEASRKTTAASEEIEATVKPKSKKKKKK